MTDLDPFEKKIIRELQRDASLTTAELAERVGLSPSPCWRRIDRLERDGYIKGRVAVVDRRKVGLHAHIFAQVKLNAHGRANLDEFSDAIAAAVKAETGVDPEPSTTGGTSDARFLRAVCPVIEFGLVNATMHKTNEAVAVEDLVTLSRIYTRIARDVLGG